MSMLNVVSGLPFYFAISKCYKYPLASHLLAFTYGQCALAHVVKHTASPAQALNLLVMIISEF